MDITLDKKGNTEGSIKISLTEADYQPKVEQKIKQYRKQVNLKGFRPGKVPANLIKKMYGRDIKVEEINGLLAEKLTQYIKENDLKIVGDPLPDREAIEGIDWENQSEFEFSYDVGYVNDIAYDLSDQVRVTKYVIPVTDEKIDETIESLKKRFGTTEDVAGASERNDLLTGVLAEVNKASDAAEGQPQEARETEEVISSEETDRSEAPGEANQEAAEVDDPNEGPLENPTTIDLPSMTDEQAQPFLGAQEGDELFFDIREVLPEDKDIARLLELSEEEAAKVQGEFSFTVEGVSREIPAEMNQAFFDKVFGPDEVADEAAFREKVREAVAENFQREADLLLSRDARDYLVAHTDIELPEAFLKRWVLATNEGTITAEQLEGEFDDYLKEMKWTLLSNKIAEDRDIQVEHEEVRQQAAESVFAQFGGMGMNMDLMNDERFAPIVDNYLQAEDGNNYMRIFSQVRAQKVIEEIKKTVTIEEKEVTTEEFNQQLEQG